MYNVLVEKLRKVRKLYARTRKQYPEIARQCKRNAQALEKQIKIAKSC